MDVECSGVLVCGLPHSGNRALVNVFRRFGLEGTACHGTDHGVSVMEGWRKRHGERLAAVFPVRSIVWRRSSLLKRYAGRSHVPIDRDRPAWELDDEIITLRTMKALTELKIPFRIVSYEAIVLQPVEHCWILLNWLGVSCTPGDVECKLRSNIRIEDGNEKHRKGADITRLTTGWAFK